MIRKFSSLILFILIALSTQGQTTFQSWPDSLFSTYYHQRASLFKVMPKSSEDIVFLGNSITDGGAWDELFPDENVKNRGISGDHTIGILNRLPDVLEGKPAKIFLLIGTNDLNRGIDSDSVVQNIFRIARLTEQYSPRTKLYVQSILPVNPVFNMFQGHTGNTEKIKQVNRRLAGAAISYNYTFIDLSSHFIDEQGMMRPEFSNDGLHLMGEGYKLWRHLVWPYVYGLDEKPALIPSPVQVEWKTGWFDLAKANKIYLSRPGLEKEAELLQDILSKSGIKFNISSTAALNDRYIELKIDEGIESSNKEAYHISVTSDRIIIRGRSQHAVFNAIQTFRQLARNGQTIDNCEIADEPKYNWRAYMTDVGRNYMSMESLKEQIDIMSQYKLNVFHFHPTEDIAWRIESKKYPQLTKAHYMQRNMGMYYTQKQIQELIDYCKERHIIFVPEIDMPGHSAAFKRAMGTDMQTEEGMAYVKEILKEFTDTFDVPYIHIGADEVKITNDRFLPEMTALLESRGRTVIGWQPGGNFSESTIRQAWLEDRDFQKVNPGLKYIDSQHLYLNHMDPLEAVTTIFNRKIGETIGENQELLGATLCTWHDRAVAHEDDILRMNAVYPGILTFAERVWNGGGQAGWITNINDGDVAGFKEFESSLLQHKDLYFQDKIFPYVKQSHLEWSISEAFPNGGDLSKKFQPEVSGEFKAETRAMGGTIVLRHWWAPMIKGALDDPAEETTRYASTQIWSDEAGEKEFWIGFFNISRAQATDSPPLGQWDQKGSKIWVNGQIIDPPVWTRPGQRANLEIPLTDENYESRETTKIRLNKGWNQVLVKLPVGSFKGKGWHNPVKYMFTFVPVE